MNVKLDLEGLDLDRTATAVDIFEKLAVENREGAIKLQISAELDSRYPVDDVIVHTAYFEFTSFELYREFRRQWGEE